MFPERFQGVLGLSRECFFGLFSEYQMITSTTCLLFWYTTLVLSVTLDVEDSGRKMLKTIPTTKFYTGKKKLNIENYMAYLHKEMFTAFCAEPFISTVLHITRQIRHICSFIPL